MPLDMSDDLNDRDRAEWEWSAEEVRRIGHRVVDIIASHLTDLPGRPVFRPVPGDLASRLLATPPPEDGAAPDAVLDAFERDVEPYPFGNGHPRFFGWVNSPPAVMGVFAEALAAAMNPSCAGGAHAAIYLERMVVSWFAALVGFPARCMGLLVSGGSMAALTALAVARTSRCGFDVRARGLRAGDVPLVFYRSREAHGCHQKAVELLGHGAESLRTVEHDADLKMSPLALDRAIRDDRRLGRRPVAVLASAGTVNTGAIDPLGAIADVCADHGVWLHVDGAYGAPAILTPRYRPDLSALARADSLTIDPHKWLCVPVEAGLVLVRDAQVMRDTFSLVPPYLRADESVGGLPWLSEYGFQQTRGFRALKVWMSLLHHGVAGYRRAIERNIRFAASLAAALRAAPEFDLLEPQNLSIVCFRYRPPEPTDDPPALDRLNRSILERIQLGGRAFLSGTELDGVFWLRACVVNPRSSEDDVLALLDIVRAAAVAT